MSLFGRFSFWAPTQFSEVIRPRYDPDGRYYSLDFMISSKNISASPRLKRSLDIFFLLGILQTNSVVAAVEVHLV